MFNRKLLFATPELSVTWYRMELSLARISLRCTGESVEKNRGASHSRPLEHHVVRAQTCSRLSGCSPYCLIAWHRAADIKV